MKIIKFGGTSISDADGIHRVLKIVRESSSPIIVVFSAVNGATDQLLKILESAGIGNLESALELKRNLKTFHYKLLEQLGLKNNDGLKRDLDKIFSRIEIFIKGIYYLREITPRAHDVVLAQGELLSSQIIASFFEKHGLKTCWFDAREVMVTDAQFGTAQPDMHELEIRCKNELEPLLGSHHVVVTQGFIGRTPTGLTTVLGRGGSDYSASLLGCAMNANVIEIWTDVSGVMTADPHIVKNAYPQQELSFKEASEMAYFGAKVLHPSSILPAMLKKIPVLVKNSFRPEDPGTIITSECLDPGRVKTIAFRKNTTVITVESSRMLHAYGFLEKIFEIFARNKISVDLISTTEVTVSLTIDECFNLEKIVRELEQFAQVRITGQMSIISLVGEEIKKTPSFWVKVFQAFDGHNVEMLTFGASNTNLSFVISDHTLEKTLINLHKVFFE